MRTASKRALVGERGEIAEEGEAASHMQGREPFEKTSGGRDARQNAHWGEEEAGLRRRSSGYPSGDRPPPGNDDVSMRMMGERRAPGVQHGGEAGRARRDAPDRRRW